MPIEGLTERIRLPRLGKIRLGVKVPNKAGTGQHPEARPYFVVPPEVAKIYGEQPTELHILIPMDDSEYWCPQYYKKYAASGRLLCQGDGIEAMGKFDEKTNGYAKTETDFLIERKVPCKGRDCPEYQSKNCTERMNLRFMIPDVPGIGIWQIDTGGINNIRNVNDNAVLIRALYGKVSMIPLTLALEPKEVIIPQVGKKTVHVLALRTTQTMMGVIKEAAAIRAQLLPPVTSRWVPSPDDNDGKPEVDPATGEILETKEEKDFASPETPTDAEFDNLKSAAKPATQPTVVEATVIPPGMDPDDLADEAQAALVKPTPKATPESIAQLRGKLNYLLKNRWPVQGVAATVATRNHGARDRFLNDTVPGIAVEDLTEAGVNACLKALAEKPAPEQGKLG